MAKKKDFVWAVGVAGFRSLAEWAAVTGGIMMLAARAHVAGTAIPARSTYEVTPEVALRYQQFGLAGLLPAK